MSRKKISTLLLVAGVTGALLLLAVVSGCGGGKEAPAISTISLPNGNVDVAYSQTLAATGGTSPYTWSASSRALPNGLSLDSSTGAINGTPTTVGTSSFTVQVTDSVGGTATKTLSITIINAAPAISTTSLPNSDLGVAYLQTLAATGGTSPYTWSVSSGALPNGLSLDSSTGAISGTPTTVGTFSFTVQVTDSAGRTAAKTLYITINAAPTITTTSLPCGDVGVAYSQTLAATGGTSSYTWSVISGALPNGLSLDSSTGAITGTPITAGTSSFTVQVTNGAVGTATASLSITINAAPAISTTSLPNSDLDVAYLQIMATTGGTSPYTWSVISGTLPSWATFNSSTGAVTGTSTTAGTSSFTVQVTDSVGGTATKTLSITINVAPAITTTSLPCGDVGVAYSQTLAATGGTSPYTWSVISGALPNGLSLDSSTGAITGTSTTAGTSNVTVRVTDSVERTAEKTLYITINAAPAISTTSLPDGNVGVAYLQILATTGGTSSYTWSVISGALPNGLSLASSTGAITGTPIIAVTSNFTVQVTDSVGGTATKILSITINAAPTISISTTSLPCGDVGVAYSQTLTTTGGTSPYTWSVISGALPNGLSLASSTGAITGTPTTAGTCNFTVRVTDSVGRTAEKTLYITINAALAISTTSLPDGNAGVAYLQILTTTGGTSPYTWSVISGALPNGLSLASSTGAITGTPAIAGISSFIVQVTDSVGGTATKTLSITIA